MRIMGISIIVILIIIPLRQGTDAYTVNNAADHLAAGLLDLTYRIDHFALAALAVLHNHDRTITALGDNR